MLLIGLHWQKQFLLRQQLCIQRQMPVDVILPCCHGNTKLCASQNEYNLEKILCTSCILREMDHCYHVLQQILQSSLLDEHSLKNIFILPPTHTQRTCIRKYLHPHIYIYVQCTYHHTHACGTLKALLNKPTQGGTKYIYLQKRIDFSYTVYIETHAQKTCLQTEKINSYHILVLGPTSYLRIMATVYTQSHKINLCDYFLNSKFRRLTVISQELVSL